MPRDLFGEVTSPSITLGTRKWYTVPLSMCVHVLVIGVLIVVPLMATGVLPSPADTIGEVILIDPPPLPHPPPVRTAAPQVSQVSPDAAPLSEPTEIREETPIDLAFEPAPIADAIAGLGEIDGAAIVAPPPAPVEKPAVPTKPVRPGGQIKPPERVNYASPLYPRRLMGP